MERIFNNESYKDMSGNVFKVVFALIDRSLSFMTIEKSWNDIEISNKLFNH